MCLSLLPATALAANDLSGHWAEDVITQWQEKGYVSGYADGSFRPNAPVTRAAFAKLMNRAVGFTEEAAISFSDVAAGDWYYHEVARAVSAGYTQGYTDGTFRPNKDITRAEAAAMIARATGLTAQESYADGFSDEIPAWARGSVGAVAAAGFMTGYADGTFHANATITRAAAVVTLDRVAKKAQETVTITEPGTTLENQLIAGDLIVAESVGEGNVYLKNVTVLGETYIRGGGSHSFYAENSRFGGTVYMQKDRLHMGLSGTTEIGNMQMEKPSSITFEKGFSGSVKDLTIPEGAPEGKYSIEAEDKDSTPVENVNLDAKADLSLGANVSKMTIGEKAEDSSITVEKDATVDSMEVNSKVEVDGKGTVDSMDVSASGVTTDKDLTVKDTTTSNGASAPTTPAAKPASSSSGSSSGGGYTRPTVTIATHQHNYNTITDKFVSFTVTGATLAREDFFITVKATADETTTTLTENTDYKVSMLGGTITVTYLTFQGDTKYTVELKASATGSSKYDITPHTYTYNGLNKVTWTTGIEGTDLIIPGTAIGAGKVKATFTVNDATINSRSEEIKATLKGSSAESSEITIDSSKITTSGSTVTVDLGGKSLSADTYTLTLSVHPYRLEITNGNRYAPNPSTASVTFTVANKEVTLGNLSYNGAIEFTSGASINSGSGFSASFPATGIASLSGGGPTAIITPKVSGSPAASDITTNIYADPQPDNAQNVVVALGGTAPTVTEDTEYTVTLTIPKEDITPATGYNAPTADLTKTFTFKVKPVPTTTPITITANTDTLTISSIADGKIANNLEIEFTVTGGVSANTSGITVVASQSEYSHTFTLTNENITFTEQASEGTLKISLRGCTAPDLDKFTDSGGFTVTIPKNTFKPIAGYDMPDNDWTFNRFKLVISVQHSGE